MNEAGGWGYTNRPNTDCAVPCCVCRYAGCCALRYWYAPYGAANGYNQSIFHNDCCEWHSDVGTVDDVPVRYRRHRQILKTLGEAFCCAVALTFGVALAFAGADGAVFDCNNMVEDKEVITVEGEDGTEIGSIIKYKYWLPPCGERVEVEALTREGESRFTIWQYSCCGRHRSIAPMHGSCKCCGWCEHDTPIHGPRTQGPEFVKTTMTWRLHTCACCYGMWLGYRSWSADATSTDKALLIGMTHAVVPIMH